MGEVLRGGHFKALFPTEGVLELGRRAVEGRFAYFVGFHARE